jgi:hypothetical protein
LLASSSGIVQHSSRAILNCILEAVWAAISEGGKMHYLDKVAVQLSNTWVVTLMDWVLLRPIVRRMEEGWSLGITGENGRVGEIAHSLVLSLNIGENKGSSYKRTFTPLRWE